MKKSRLRTYLKRGKTRFLFLIFSFFILNASGNIHFQNKKVNINLENANLESLFREIQKQTGYKFVFNHEELGDIQLNSILCEGKEVGVLLKEVLQEFGYNYNFENEIIVVVPAEKPNASGQNIKEIHVKGKVMDQNKAPIPGVTVMIKDTKVGTVTNVKGVFNFNLPEMELPIYLRFSFIGMDSQEVKYTGQDSLFVTMVESTETLGEVVVTGFGEVDKRLSTSAITSLKMEDIMVPGVSSLDQMLEGRVPGMMFMQNSGQVGATPRLRVRGTSTILGNQEPLWVLDGIVLDDPVDVSINQINDLDFTNLLGNAISGLNPFDIERIDVLKDASATALYGASAANGVIVITTKKGEVGPPRYSYSLTTTITRRPHYSDRAMYVMNSQDRVDLSRELIENGVKFSNDVTDNLFGYEEAYVNHFKYGIIDVEEFNRLSSFYQTVNTDWFKHLMSNSFSNNHSFGVSGGSESGNYRISLGYTDEQGTIKKEFGKRFTVSSNISSKFRNTYLSFGVNAYKYNRQYTPETVGVNTYAYSTSRAIPKYNIDGEMWSYNKDEIPYNIFMEIDNSEYKIEQKNVNFNLSIKQDIFKFLKINLTGSYSYSFSHEETWYGELSHYIRTLNQGSNLGCPFGGELKTTTNRNDNYTLRAQLDFNKFFDDDNVHHVFASFGGDMRSSKYKTSELTERGYMRERGGMFPKFDESYEGLKDYAEFVKWKMDQYTEYRYRLTNNVSSYFSASYSYKNKYVFNVNGRVDFSNAFGDRSREKFNPIWSISGKWDVKRDLFEYIKFINQLNLRMSYGIQGNMRNDQPTRLILTRGQYAVSVGKYTSKVKYFPNPDLKWEKTHSLNIGLDFSLFNNSINATLSYYYKKTIDAFYDKPVSDINGVTTYVVNKGNIENKGFEISLNINPIPLRINEQGKRGFYWRFDPQISQALNRLLNSTIKGNKTFTQEIYKLSNYLDGSAVVEGDPLNTLYSFKFKSLDSEGKPVFYDLEKENKKELIEKYEAMETEEVYKCFLKKSGRRIPILQGGLSNTFGYRDFSLRFNLSYSFGSKVRLLKLVSGEYSGISPQAMQNVRREFKNRWRVPGDEEFKIIPGVEKGISEGEGHFWFENEDVKKWTDDYNMYSAYDHSDIRVVSGSYLRLQSMTFSYQINNNIIRKIGLSNANISFSGSNLFTIAHKDLRGQNPEQSGTSRLINLSVRPKYTLSLSFGF